MEEERIGLLGICAGGGYAINAALTEYRFKAVAKVVANDIGRAFRSMLPDVRQTLVNVGKQRTAEARGNRRRNPWILDSLKEAEAAGATDPDLLEAVTFYRESGYRHPNSTNRLESGPASVKDAPRVDLASNWTPSSASSLKSRRLTIDLETPSRSAADVTPPASATSTNVRRSSMSILRSPFRDTVRHKR